MNDMHQIVTKTTPPFSQLVLSFEKLCKKIHLFQVCGPLRNIHLLLFEIVMFDHRENKNQDCNAVVVETQSDWEMERIVVNQALTSTTECCFNFK